MYEAFFGLAGAPFSLLPDADFLYPSNRHQRAIHHLEYGIMARAGFIVITGEVGAGKTTILRRFIRGTEKGLAVGLITNPSETFGKLLSWVAQAYEIPTAGLDDAGLYQAFVAFLLKQYGQGHRSLLIIDEAQNLSAQMLEELRMLSNVNNEKDQILQIILVGQPELLQMLKKSELRQFVQRISVHCHLDGLSAQETAAYISHRLSVVGCTRKIFDDGACLAVHAYTQGIPRLINLLCDQALVYAFSDEAQTVTASTIAEVANDRARSGLTPFKTLPDAP